MHRYVPVRLTVCADAAVAANMAAAAMTHVVILMKITPSDYADPTIGLPEGSLIIRITRVWFHHKRRQAGSVRRHP
jgi:hypothetical protein